MTNTAAINGMFHFFSKNCALPSRVPAIMKMVPTQDGGEEGGVYIK